MCLTLSLSRFTVAVCAAGLLAFAGRPALAADAHAGAFAPSLSTVTSDNLTIGYFTPAYGLGTLGLSPIAPALSRTLGTGGVNLVQTFESGGRYTTPLSFARVGVFGNYDQRQSILGLAPATAWTFGASVGYAGFYVQGGVNESASVGPMLGMQGLQAGFGYEIGSFDLRVTYLTAQGVGISDRSVDNRQMTLGGIYQLTPRIRLNADAFYGISDGRRPALAVQSPLAAPPGTGARVGVELRF
jgi:hypothetical protein